MSGLHLGIPLVQGPCMWCAHDPGGLAEVQVQMSRSGWYGACPSSASTQGCPSHLVSLWTTQVSQVYSRLTVGLSCLVGVAAQAPRLGARVLDLNHTLEPPGENLKSWVARLHPRLINSESLGVWPRHQVAFKAPKHPSVQVALKMAGLDTASLRAGEEGA